MAHAYLRLRSVTVLAGSALLALAAPVAAQTVTNPRNVEFSPSVDHNTTLSSGQPAVSRYDLEVYQAGASAPFQTKGMGKPSPAGDGLIHYDFSGQVVGWPLPGGTYEMRVSAIGPNGTGRSTPSNQFTLSQFAFCTYGWSTASATVAATAGSGTVTLNTQTGCQWTASSSASWLTINAASGNATTAITYSFTANPATSPRTATITAGGQTFTVTQAGVACTFTLSAATASVAATAGSGTFTLTAPSGCTWSASSNQTWLAVSPTTGSGNGTVTFTYTANPSGTSRSGAITAGGQTFTVTQAGVTCTFTLSPSSADVPSAGGTGSFTLTTQTGCAWTTTSDSSWLTASPPSGNGNATISFAAAANAGSAIRVGRITVGGQVFTVTETSGPPAAPTNLRVTATGQ